MPTPNTTSTNNIVSSKDNATTPHAPADPPRLAFSDQVLAAILHRRLSLPQHTLAVLFGCSSPTMHRVLRHTGQLLDQHSIVIEPATLPLPAHLTKKIKSAS
jgi:hypothetical protein